MFKKLKEKIEDTNGLDKSLSSVKKAPGLPMRAASNDTVPNSITPLRSESIGDIMADKMDSSREDINTDNDMGVASMGVSDREREGELLEEIEHLRGIVEEKDNNCKKMEKKIAELQWTVDNLNSRLHLFNNFKGDELTQKLQDQISELEMRLRQREIDIEIYETRISAQSKQRHNDNMATIKKTRGFEETIKSLQASVSEKDAKLQQLNGDLLNIRVQLTEVEKKRAELDHMIQDQSDKLKGKDEMMEYQLMEHSEEVDQLKSEHNQNIEELQSEIQSLKEQLENKDAKLNRLITELPDQPLVQTVLEGYSKSQMASTFSSSLQTPGGVYRKEVEPLPRPEGLPLKSVGSIDGEGSSPPAILPIENHSLFEGDQLEVVSYHELVELRKENELLQEQLEGKDKTIRLQQQKLADMKKTLSKELVHRTPSPPPPPLPPPSLQRHDSENIDKNSIKLSLSSDVNFQYLKNVVIKFLCCRDAEAVHLIKAIAMLLELNNEEEKYMRDFFDYKLSWFGTMPLPPQTPNIK